MINRYPAVIKIHAHLEGEHIRHVTSQRRPRTALGDCGKHAIKSLLKYFKRPDNACFSNLTILDYYEQYTVSICTPLILLLRSRRQANTQIVTIASCPNEHMTNTFAVFPSKAQHWEIYIIYDFCFPRCQDGLFSIYVPFTLPMHLLSYLHPNFHNAARARGFVTGDVEYTIRNGRSIYVSSW